MKKLSAVLISALMVMVMAVTVFAAPAATQTAPAEAGSNIAPGTEVVNPQQIPVAQQQQQQAAPVVPMTEESIDLRMRARAMSATPSPMVSWTQPIPTGPATLPTLP